MLKTCPECQLPISDKALVCPHCGFPLIPAASVRRRRKPKRMKLPNGFGQIIEIKNANLRNSFRAMVTVRKDDTGHPISKILKPKGYFQTYNEAYEALVEYHKNPYDLSDTYTMAELYEEWMDYYLKSGISDSTIDQTYRAWKFCSSMYSMRVKDVRIHDLRFCIYDGKAKLRGGEKSASPALKNYMKTMFNKMFDYAVEHEYTDQNYARKFSLDRETSKQLHHVERPHLNYTDEEVQLMWDHLNDVSIADMLLIQCYSGWRPQELVRIKLENVNLEEKYFIGGMKTEYGVNRTVPIHSKIYPLVVRRYNEAQDLQSDFLFNFISNSQKNNRRDIQPYTYDRFRLRYSQNKSTLGLDPKHCLHDGRVRFITQAKRYGVDEYTLKRLVGHSIKDITESVYTKRDLEWLRSEIEKIE